METIKVTRLSLWLLIWTIHLSCGLKPVERETVVEGSVLLTTGEPVTNYPLSIVGSKGTFFGVRNPVSRQDIQTDKQGKFAYKGLLESGGLDGQGYDLEYAHSFKINAAYYSVDTIQASIPDAGINITPGYRFDGTLFAGKQHTITIFLKKDQ